MSRPIRIEFSGALYHITSRGDRRQSIYEDDTDRERFLKILGQVIEDSNWICHAYCLMTDHYHLVIETPDGNLSKGMRQLNGVYTQASNRHHRRTRHLFQGHYKDILARRAEKRSAFRHDNVKISNQHQCHTFHKRQYNNQRQYVGFRYRSSNLRVLNSLNTAACQAPFFRI